MTRSALPTFVHRTSKLTLLFWGGTTASGQLLGQVQSFSYDATISNQTAMRVGDSTEHEVLTILERPTWELVLWEESNLGEIGYILAPTAWATATGSGSWSGTEDIVLDPTQTATTITVANYDGEATSSTLLWTETLSSAYVKSLSAPRVAANEGIQWTFGGTAETVTIEPSAMAVS